MAKKINRQPNIVCIGGGTGTYSVLTGLRKYFDTITAVVSMADTGGSARKERDEFGLLPSSDIRKSLIGLAEAQSEEENLLRELFQYRYSQGKGVTGMTFGNLFLVALTKLLGSQTAAIEKAGQILRIRGQVLPVSLEAVDLVAVYENGLKVVGEHKIDEPKHDHRLLIAKLSTKSKAHIYHPVADAIDNADLIVLGPGGLYTTLIANLVIDGISDAICKSNAKVVFIMNLMTEPGQTYAMSASGHILEVQKYLGCKRLDYVLINNASLPRDIIYKYKTFDAKPVRDDLEVKNGSYQVIRADLLFPSEIKKVSGDTLKRSLIRHDSEKLAKQLIKLL